VRIKPLFPLMTASYALALGLPQGFHECAKVEILTSGEPTDFHILCSVWFHNLAFLQCPALAPDSLPRVLFSGFDGRILPAAA
jgi:hypothetical protein